MAKQNWWDNVDWTLSNHDIAKQVGRALNTVEHRRSWLGMAYKGKAEPRSDKGVSKPQPHLNKPEYQRLGTDRVKQSPRSGRFETNVKAKTWTIKSPNNKTYTFTNLMHFVRTHEQLFEPSDVVWRKKANGVEWCRASSGIGGLANKANKSQQWKGWQLISVIETN